jgi:hypothetical protein
MRLHAIFCALVLTLSGAAGAAVSFRPVDVYVDSGEAALGAYQLDIRYDRAHVKIAGLEGGETKAFGAAPYYDPKGLEAGRIVVAAFVPENTDATVAPRGRTRVARLHLNVEAADAKAVDAIVGRMTVKLVIAADVKARRIEARAELGARTGTGDKEAQDEEQDEKRIAGDARGRVRDDADARRGTGDRRLRGGQARGPAS